MGTNFYLRGYVLDSGQYQSATSKEVADRSLDDDMHPSIHIGKRSAAGPYCWDCGVTFCKQGEERIHHTNDSDWLEACPKCGQKPLPNANSLRSGAVAVELGFAQPNTERPTGVGSCSSFTWAQPPDEFRQFAGGHRDDEVVQDEYGRTMTAKDFLAMLEMNCPIEYQHSIGEWFC